jgi:MFS family permease
VALAVAALGSFLAAQGEAWPYFALAFFLTGFGGALSNVAIRAAEVSIVSPGELARVVGVARLSSYGALSLAAPLGGFLVTWYGVAWGSFLLFLMMLIVALLTMKWSPLRDDLAPLMPDIPRKFRHSYRAKQALHRTSRTMRAANKRVRLAKLVVDTAEDVMVRGDADMTKAELAINQLAPTGSQAVSQSLGVPLEMPGQSGGRRGDGASSELRSRPHPA